MDIRRLIGAYVAILHKIGKITHICRYKFHLRKLYHIMRYEGEWVVVSCRSLHRILTFAGNPWEPFKKYVLPLCMARADPFILSCDIPLSVMEHFRSAAFAPVIRALGFT